MTKQERIWQLRKFITDEKAKLKYMIEQRYPKADIEASKDNLQYFRRKLDKLIEDE